MDLPGSCERKRDIDEVVNSDRRVDLCRSVHKTLIWNGSVEKFRFRFSLAKKTIRVLRFVFVWLVFVPAN